MLLRLGVYRRVRFYDHLLAYKRSKGDSQTFFGQSLKAAKKERVFVFFWVVTGSDVHDGNCCNNHLTGDLLEASRRRWNKKSHSGARMWQYSARVTLNRVWILNQENDSWWIVIIWWICHHMVKWENWELHLWWLRIETKSSIHFYKH